MFTLEPVGIVRSQFKEPARQDWQAFESEIVIDARFAPALDCIEDFSHMYVTYWMHLVPEEERRVLRVHPRRDESLPVVGVFAARSPARPNPLGLCLVRLVARKGNVLRVRGLDAVDGTPVIDLKPYLPGYDSSADARLPGWARPVDEHGRAA